MVMSLENQESSFTDMRIWQIRSVVPHQINGRFYTTDELSV